MSIIKIGVTNDDKNKLEKIFNIRASLECEIFTPCDITSPILILSNDSVLSTDNYIYIPDFDRFYFIENIEKNGEIITLSLICDVLMSFKDEIKNCPLIAERSTNIFNGFIPDNERKFKNYDINEFKVLGEFSELDNYLLGVG